MPRSYCEWARLYSALRYALLRVLYPAGASLRHCSMLRLPKKAYRMVHKRHCVPPAFSLRDPQLEALCQEGPTGFVLVRPFPEGAGGKMGWYWSRLWLALS
ncbi:hypothetical protein AGR4C_Lc80127 [Agrobacterium tumefaciens str. Kerr 14]|uniref:Uncharacterized protein n=1 Tax=Agrobacterium tumefaciens str. Kerr 14 TaxID=1183424 RepID=A0A1S7S4D2_AGRTU|nr:hypothetical protein AGR4C_Lc80127 [Agrobacterium tumefaciens str. Kerr 14]